MNRQMHWLASVAWVLMVVIAVTMTASGLLYLAFMVITKATWFATAGAIFAALMWCGKVVDKYGFAWNSKNTCE